MIKTDISFSELKAFSGPGGYENIWMPHHEGTSKTAGFNFWAAYFGIYWFFYRKMYALGIASLAFDIAFPVATSFPVRYFFQSPHPPNDKFGVLIVLGSFVLWRIVLGWLANILYYRKAVKLITSISEANLTNDSYLSAISSFGGASIPSVISLAIAAGLLKIVAL